MMHTEYAMKKMNTQNGLVFGKMAAVFGVSI